MAVTDGLNLNPEEAQSSRQRYDQMLALPGDPDGSFALAGPGTRPHLKGYRYLEIPSLGAFAHGCAEIRALTREHAQAWLRARESNGRCRLCCPDVSA